MSGKASVRIFLSALPPGSIDLRRRHLLDRARTMILDGYGAVYSYIARAAHRIATPEEVCLPEKSTYVGTSMH